MIWCLNEGTRALNSSGMISIWIISHGLKASKAVTHHRQWLRVDSQGDQDTLDLGYAPVHPLLCRQYIVHICSMSLQQSIGQP